MKFRFPHATISAAVLGLALLVPTVASAQSRDYISHRNYTPANGEDAQALFARAYPGMPVADRPGYVWRHDGRGWYFELATTATPAPPAPDLASPTDDACQTVDPYTQPVLAVLCRLERDLGQAPAPTSFFKRDDGGNATISVQPIAGRRYTHVISAKQMVVLSLTLDTRGRTVVTFEWLSGDTTGRIETGINGGMPHGFLELAH